MNSNEVTLPDVGVEGEVEVIELLVAVGDSVEIDTPVIVVESDKATVEVPSPSEGKITAIKVKVGDKISMGDELLTLNTEGEDSAAQVEPSSTDNSSVDKSEITKDELPDEQAQAEDTPAQNSDDAAASKQSSDTEYEVQVPDLGGGDKVEVIEITVEPGQEIDQDDTLLVLESDKATMEIPSPVAGKLARFKVSVGDKVSEGDVIAVLTGVTQQDGAVDDAPLDRKSAPQDAEASGKQGSSPPTAPEGKAAPIPEASPNASVDVHAGPAVRKLARELGADLARVSATGPKSRILKEDLEKYIKSQVTLAQSGGHGGGSSLVPELKLPDFSLFGEIEVRKLEKIQRITAENMTTSWLSVPHVTQFDEADITEMESFRKQKKSLSEQKGVKLTPLPFLLKACAYALEALPQFNVSLDMANGSIVQKKYIHIGVAVDTPAGLVVPVLRDVNQKSIWQLAAECMDLAAKAKNRKLKPAEMQGGCFTISSLGSIGGTAFTPIVNTPEVAILGVSKAQYKPVYDGEQFVPRLMLPLSLSYDHRAVNGADAARFTSVLTQTLGDLRELLL